MHATLKNLTFQSTYTSYTIFNKTLYRSRIGLKSFGAPSSIIFSKTRNFLYSAVHAFVRRLRTQSNESSSCHDDSAQIGTRAIGKWIVGGLHAIRNAHHNHAGLIILNFDVEQPVAEHGRPYTDSEYIIQASVENWLCQMVREMVTMICASEYAWSQSQTEPRARAQIVSQ